jgi:membrane protein implicated in regulation of membrane protease activity
MDAMLLADYAVWIWISAALTLILLEVIMGFPLVFFITGLAAFSAAFAIWLWPILVGSVIDQVIVFLGAIPLWALILWKPLKLALKKHKEQNNFLNIVGQSAIVNEAELIKGKSGNIRWSGTIVRAQLSQDVQQAKVSAGEEVTIVEVKENIFIVKHKE